MLHPLAREIVVSSPLEAKIGLVEVLVAETEFCNLKECISGEVVMLRILGYLFKVENCFFLLRYLILDALGKEFADVEVCLYFGGVFFNYGLEVR